ncbi:MAG: PIG-L family deacetylase [Bdellovibrionales bacterium]
MARVKPNLIVVAHPDDESIFFGGLIQRERRQPWRLICVTDGNGDGRGQQRHQELLAAAKALKINQVEQWGYPDRYSQRLEVEDLSARLKKISSQVRTVFTHGILGEYGHPHHQDVSYAVHCAFHRLRPVWSVAYNIQPQKRITLTPRQFALKCKILSDTYRLETERFLHLLPATADEGFCRLSQVEVEAVYATVRWQQPLKTTALKHHRWLAKILSETAYCGLQRPF